MQTVLEFCYKEEDRNYGVIGWQDGVWGGISDGKCMFVCSWKDSILREREVLRQ
jgi:hypothetical protein